MKSVLLLRVSSDVDKDVDHPQFFDPCYPIKYLQAGLKVFPGLKVHLLDCWIHPMGVNEVIGKIHDLAPDLVVISSSSFDANVSHDIAAALKKSAPAPLIVGIGQGHYLYREGAALSHQNYDAILLGEPEEEFFRLFAWIRRNGGSDTGWREHYRRLFRQGQRFMVQDMNRLPFPEYTSDELRAYKSIYPVQLNQPAVWGFIIATRGCPHGCMFCSEVMRVSIGTRLRSRSAANVADEMACLKRQGVNIISFQDDSFSANAKFVDDLCTELISRGSTLPWMARVRVDELSRKMLTKMHQAGCIMLGIGVESGSQRIIEAMEKRRRPVPWVPLCKKVFDWIHGLGIGVNAYYVIGNPTETRAEIRATMRLARSLNADSIQIHFYTPYPGSRAWEKYGQQLKDQDPTQMFHYALPLIPLAAVSNDELENLRAKFYLSYMLRPGFILRHFKRHLGFYRNNPDVFWSLLGIRKLFI